MGNFINNRNEKSALNPSRVTRYASRFIPVLFLILSVSFNLYCLFPEISHITPDLNDNVFHYGLVLRMHDAIKSGETFWDCWVPYWLMGFPVFHYYQFLPHFLVVIIYYVLGKSVDLFTLFKIIQYLLLSTFPVSIYLGLRKLDFTPLEASLSGLTVSLLSTNCLYGWEWESYIWVGFGMFSQLCGMYVMPLALGEVYRCINTGKGYFRAVFFLCFDFLCHFFFGYIVSLLSFYIIFTVPEKKKIFYKFKNLSVIALFSFLVLMHILIPFFLHREYHSQSVYDPYWKWYSYGMELVLKKFFNGELLDNKRFPVLTILALAGFLISLSRNREHYRTAWFVFLFGFLTFFGKPFWGEFIKILFPMGESLHIHRVINIFDLGSVMLFGIGLAWLWQKIDYLKNRNRLFISILLTFLILLPAFYNRFNYSRDNLYWIKDGETKLSQDVPDFSSVMKSMKNLDYVRVYPGLRASWGNGLKVGSVQVYSMLPVNKINALSYLPFTWSLNADIQCFFDESRYSHYRLFNIGYVLCDPNMKFPPFAAEIEKKGKYSLRHIKDTGYFDLIDVPVLVKGNKNSVWVANLMWLRSNYVDKGQHMAIDFENTLNPSDFKRTIVMKDRITFIENQKEKNLFSENIFNGDYPFTGERGKILSVFTDGFKYEAHVVAEKECYLLFKMTYHPNWHVTVDGKEADKIQVSPYFTGVKILKGNHKVNFYYDPGRVKKILLYTGIFSLVFLFLWEKRRGFLGFMGLTGKVRYKTK